MSGAASPAAAPSRRQQPVSGRTLGALTWLMMLLLPACGEQPTEPSPEACGGHLTARRGTISTPNFPGPFAVPLRCRWILDASELGDRANVSIVVYFGQLYVFRGLGFHEYAYYESEATGFGGALVSEIDEGNVFEVRRLRTLRPYLVVDFRLDRLEGNHVRVLDRLLDVYGFNLTYEMTDLGENEDSCSLADCSFAGDCLLAADYATFYCDCFEGFGGRHCGHGPLCVTERGNPICRNGGTCRHVGAAAMRCLCPPQYSGDFCEISSTVSEESGGCAGADCVLQCPYPAAEKGAPAVKVEQQRQRRQPCPCKKLVRQRKDRTRFECRIKLTNVTYPRGVDFPATNASLEDHLAKQNFAAHAPSEKAQAPGDYTPSGNMR